MRLYLTIAFAIFFGTVSNAQNYLGFSKQYITKAMKSERKNMAGPVRVKDEKNNFITYISKDDAKRVVYYHFQLMPVNVNGKKTDAEICIKYVSITKCPSPSKCPDLDDVRRSLDSQFNKKGTDIWVDHTKQIPQQWIVVREEDHFEVHVSEVAQ